MMKITINVSKEDLEHLLPNHTFFRSCSNVKRIMVKVQKKYKEIKNKQG